MHGHLEKKAKQYDRVVADWKLKVDNFSRNLDSAQAEARNKSAELFQVRKAYEESGLQLDEVR